MPEAILAISFVTFLIPSVIKCENPPIWQKPTDSSTFTINIDHACTLNFNVLSSVNPYARSVSGDTVHYRIVSQSPNDGAFSLRQHDFTSENIVTCVKDKVKSPSYDVVLGAYYMPRTDENEATVKVKISVEGIQIQIKKPEFITPNPDSSKDDHFITMPESVQPGGNVIKLVASDGDESNGSTLTYNMDKSPVKTRQLFEIKEGTDMLKVKSNISKDYFDAERKGNPSTYPIVLEVSNGVKASSMSTEIKVLDINDHAPEFSGNRHAKIPSSSKAGNVVLTLTVTDKDETSPNNKVSLSLSGPSEFKLEGKDIVVAEGAKFASKARRYILIAAATDNASENSKFTRENIVITVGDDTSGSAKEKANMMSAVFMALVVCFFHYS